MSINPVKPIKTLFQKRFDKWIDKRIPLQTEQLKLSRKSIYILPTKFGFLFGLILVAMLVGSINYEINMGFLLTFLFSAIFFIGMLQSYKNFNTVTLAPQPIKPVFASENVTVNFLSLSKHITFNTAIQIEKQQAYHNLNEKSLVPITIKGYKRGIYRINKIKLFSIYPMGHFYVWSWFKTDLEIIVYPQPKAISNTEQISKTNKVGENSSQRKGSDELYSYKHYQAGDPIQRIAWKKTAQTGKLHSKEMSKLISDDYYIDWHQFSHLATEERLSLMCHLVLDAHNRNEMYGLILPDVEINPEHSEQHKHACLKELASFGDYED